jgi:hypothetical protein
MTSGISSSHLSLGLRFHRTQTLRMPAAPFGCLGDRLSSPCRIIGGTYELGERERKSCKSHLENLLSRSA